MATQKALEVAIDIALMAHAGQVDKQGEPYIFHPLRVMEALRGKGFDYQIVGVLHDVVEDSWWSLDDLRARGFDADIVAAVDAVTRRKEQGESYQDFIQRAAANRIGRAVKIADVRDHLSRMTPEFEGLRAKYARALAVLEFADPGKDE